jgi:hypothetical protein
MALLLAFGLFAGGGGQFALGALSLTAGTVIAMVRPVPPGYEWTRAVGSALMGIVVLLLVIAIFHPVEPFYHLGSDDWLTGQYGTEQNRRSIRS